MTTMNWWRKPYRKSLVLRPNHYQTPVYIVGILLLMISTADAFAGSRHASNFQCPLAYLGIKSDMLPTYWEPTDQGKKIRARQSYVQGKYMICIYREPTYREPTGKLIGNVRRLIPKGYRCITGGRGAFQCTQSMNRRNRRR